MDPFPPRHRTARRGTLALALLLPVLPALAPPAAAAEPDAPAQQGSLAPSGPVTPALAGKGPETPAFPRGLAPPPLRSWDVPPRLRRAYAVLGAGLPSFLPRLAAFSRHPHEEQDLTYAHVFGPGLGRTLVASLDAGVHVSPCLAVSLGAWAVHARTSTRSVPDIDFAELVKLASIGTGWVCQVSLGLRLSLPLSLDPDQALAVDRAVLGEGFAPYLRMACGPAFHSGMSITVLRQSLEERKTLFRSSVAFSFVAALGLECRFSPCFAYAEAGYGYLGRPESAWPDYSDAESMQAFHVTMGLGVYLF